MATTFEDAHNATQPEPKMIPATITREQLHEMIGAFGEAWEEKRKEIGRGISPAGIKREAGLTAALTTLGISVEEENE